MRCDPHQRWPVAVGQRNGLARWCFNDSEGVLVAREGGDGVLQLEEETGNKGRAILDGGGSSLKGAVSAVGGFTSGGVGVPSAVDCGQEARGVGEVVLMACLRRRKRVGKRNGQAASVMPFTGVAGGNGRRGGCSGWRPRGRDEWREGGPSAPVGSQY
jgi:hypothetical protein